MLDRDVFADLAGYDAATVSNAIETFDVRPRTEGFTDATVRCMYPDLPPIAGRAITCRMENTAEGRGKTNRLPDVFDALRGLGDPAVIVCSFVGSDPERSCLIGDLIAAMFQRLGAVAVVTDCSARDLDVVRRRAPGFQIFARGTVASHGLATVVEVGEPVTVGGLEINPGDVIHGDQNGVVSVPEAIAASVAGAARGVLDREEAMQRRIHADPFDYEALRADFTH